MKSLPLILALALSACSSGGEEAGSVAPVALVKTAPATLDGASETITLYGAVDAGQAGERALSSPVEAVIASVDAPVGTKVHSGQVIVRLSPSPNVRLDVAKASADARAAGDAFARVQRLRADGLMSDGDVNAARAAATAAGATLSSLQSRGRGLTLTAPVSGTVALISGSPGDVVAGGATVARVQMAGDVRARFGIDPAAARRISVGASIRITPSGGDTPFTVRVDTIDKTADATTRLASLYARIPSSVGVGQGEALRGDLKIGEGAAQHVSVPYAALLDDGGQPFVFIVKNGIAHRRDVVVANEGEEGVSLTSGVTMGEQVVTAGGTGLEDGIKVRDH